MKAMLITFVLLIVPIYFLSDASEDTIFGIIALSFVLSILALIISLITKNTQKAISTRKEKYPEMGPVGIVEGILLTTYAIFNMYIYIAPISLLLISFITVPLIAQNIQISNSSLATIISIAPGFVIWWVAKYIVETMFKRKYQPKESQK